MSRASSSPPDPPGTTMVPDASAPLSPSTPRLKLANERRREQYQFAVVRY